MSNIHQIEDVARRFARENCSHLLNAAGANQELFEQYVEAFSRQFAKEVYALIPFEKANRAFNFYERIKRDYTDQECHH